MQELQRIDRLIALPPVPAGGAEEEPPQEAAPRRQSRRGAAAGGGTGRQRRAAQNAASEGPPAFAKDYVPRLRSAYAESVVPTLMEEFGYQNPMQVPRLQKIVLNIGAGDAREDARILEGIQRDLTTIAGQKPVVTRARKSIAGFKIRDGNTIGASVTLRGNRMWDFLDRLMNIALPRTRDFRGVSPRGFDGRGDYSLGFREQIIFPEIDYNRVDRIRGFQVSIVTSAKSDDEGRRLLALLGMPFAHQEAD